jgi:hypothetical protein
MELSSLDGATEGSAEGTELGPPDGILLGCGAGTILTLGLPVGALLGCRDGSVLGRTDEIFDGAPEG